MHSHADHQFDRIFSLEIIKINIFLFLRTFTPSYIVFPLKEEKNIKTDFQKSLEMLRGIQYTTAPWPDSSII